MNERQLSELAAQFVSRWLQRYRPEQLLALIRENHDAELAEGLRQLFAVESAKLFEPSGFFRDDQTWLDLETCELLLVVRGNISAGGALLALLLPVVQSVDWMRVAELVLDLPGSWKESGAPKLVVNKRRITRIVGTDPISGATIEFSSLRDAFDAGFSRNSLRTVANKDKLYRGLRWRVESEQQTHLTNS